MQEGATLRLEVRRERGNFRDVHVNWMITPDAGIVNASSQISPMNGTITFRQVSIKPHLSFSFSPKSCLKELIQGDTRMLYQLFSI